ncbi:Vacuolar protein-sorting-associated protein 36 [Coemansia biformis]|uniref:Vacuolar protein-sorting-associated protein 36 n=1 Tax=Coemansia biformis TaxID=1286918 RepID=A0A9W7YH06_9FUNG|nr:Vacuolar protein-sorting-associated protein 36 [Coemansia biformis]
MEPAELAPTLRPLLARGESIICVQNRVGLYKGAARDEEHDNGTVYLTTRRVVYVDQQRPRERSVALDLAHVHQCSLHSGFLYASGKISLRIRPPVGSNGSSAPGARPDTPLLAAGADPEAGWRCTICEHANRDGAKCALCGVPRQAGAPDLGFGGAGGPSALGTTASDAVRCPTCTFDNHTSMARCEMCDGELRPATPARADHGDAASPMREADSDEGAGEVVRLSFRGGGSSQFYTALKDALSDPAWTAPPAATDGTPGDARAGPRSTTGTPPAGARGRTSAVGGISTIVSTAHATERARDVTLRSGFSDLDALTATANELVEMAEHIATQLNSPAASKLRRKAGGESDEDSAARVDAFRRYLLDLGIDSPVTKDSAGAVFHEELARELCDYLENYVSKCGGTVALVDAYCLYNRAREFSLVYPSDFVQACRKFEELGLSLRLREYPSGLLAIEDPGTASDALIATRIGSYIQSFGPVTANDVAAMEDCPLTLAEERLWLCERAGQVCRDESVEGVRFYANVFRDGSGCV